MSFTSVSLAADGDIVAGIYADPGNTFENVTPSPMTKSLLARISPQGVVRWVVPSNGTNTTWSLPWDDGFLLGDFYECRAVDQRGAVVAGSSMSLPGMPGAAVKTADGGFIESGYFFDSTMVGSKKQTSAGDSDPYVVR